MELFKRHCETIQQKNAPLADRMRPRTLDEYIGQEHIIGKGRLLRRAIQIDQLSSLIFYGPPGTGKTTLARIIANTTKAQFISINAVLAGVKDIREAIKSATDALGFYSKRTILFIDEVHRFNKAQQDALLPNVENGTLTLIGATTENPYFEVNKALVSRSRIFQLTLLGEDHLREVALQAIQDKERGYGNKNIKLEDDAISHLVSVVNGDARGVLNALELAVETTEPQNCGTIIISRSVIEDSIQQRAVLYDKDGDAHYDTISAFIKSIRGSDPDAALYWMAKMLYAGEDPRFILRRLIILASEDIGLADPNALGIVMAAAQAFDYIGLPEGRFPLTQAVLYLATAPKSNTTLCFYDAFAAVKGENDSEVPNHLKDASRDKDGLGHGQDYIYPHAYRDHWIAQQYLPNTLQGKCFYEPTDQGYEKGLCDQVARRREAQLAAMVEHGSGDLWGDGSVSGQKMWESRTSGCLGKNLATLRDTLLEMADLTAGQLILDTSGGTGLLLFEAVRRVRDGSFWALAYDDRSYDTLTTLVRKLASLDQPQIVKSDIAQWQTAIIHSAGYGVQFDRIIGRNLFAMQNKREIFLEQIDMILGNLGKAVFAETLHVESQRIADLVTLSAKYQKLLSQAENAIFSDIENPLTNWDDSTIKKLPHSKNIQLRTKKNVNIIKRRISKGVVTYWFRTSLAKDRMSLGDHIRRFSDTETADHIQKLLNADISCREIDWKQTILFVEIIKLQ